MSADPLRFSPEFRAALETELAELDAANSDRMVSLAKQGFEVLPAGAYNTLLLERILTCLDGPDSVLEAKLEFQHGLTPRLDGIQRELSRARLAGEL